MKYKKFTMNKESSKLRFFSIQVIFFYLNLKKHGILSTVFFNKGSSICDFFTLKEGSMDYFI